MYFKLFKAVSEVYMSVIPCLKSPDVSVYITSMSLAHPIICQTVKEVHTFHTRKQCGMFHQCLRMFHQCLRVFHQCLKMFEIVACLKRSSQQSETSFVWMSLWALANHICTVYGAYKHKYEHSGMEQLKSCNVDSVIKRTLFLLLLTVCVYACMRIQILPVHCSSGFPMDCQ